MRKTRGRYAGFWIRLALHASAARFDAPKKVLRCCSAVCPRCLQRSCKRLGLPRNCLCTRPAGLGIFVARCSLAAAMPGLIRFALFLFFLYFFLFDFFPARLPQFGPGASGACVLVALLQRFACAVQCSPPAASRNFEPLNLVLSPTVALRHGDLLASALLRLQLS